MKLVNLVFFFLFLSVANVFAQTYVLKTAAQHSPPKFITLEDGSIGGIAIDVMRAIETIEPSIKFSGDQSYMPFKRIQTSVASGLLDVFVAFGENAERRKKYNYVYPAIYNTLDGIFVLSEDPIEINSLEDIKKIPDHLVITNTATATVPGNQQIRA